MQVIQVRNPQVVVNAIMPLVGIAATLLFAGLSRSVRWAVRSAG